LSLKKAFASFSSPSLSAALSIFQQQQLWQCKAQATTPAAAVAFKVSEQQQQGINGQAKDEEEKGLFGSAAAELWQ
jgi:hypothetical protein